MNVCHILCLHSYLIAITCWFDIFSIQIGTNLQLFSKIVVNSRRMHDLAVSTSIIMETWLGECLFLLNWSNELRRAWTNINWSNMTVREANWCIWYAFVGFKSLVNERVSYLMHEQLPTSCNVSVWHNFDPNRNKFTTIFENHRNFSENAWFSCKYFNYYRNMARRVSSLTELIPRPHTVMNEP
jgi:hypothetical protein